MKIAAKSFYSPGGDLHTRETLHRSPTRWFIRTWSVLRCVHGDEHTISSAAAKRFIRESGRWRIDWSRIPYQETRADNIGRLLQKYFPEED